MRLEIIATTYCSKIFKTHVFSLYSHLCIYVSMYLCIYIATYLHMLYLDWQQPAPEDDDRVNSEIHSEAMTEGVWRCTWRLRSCELRDAFGGCD